MTPLGTIIPLPKFEDPRGNLTVAEGKTQLPFEIARAYWVTDVPGGECRGGHAHKRCREFIVATSGSFDVTLDNGSERKTYHLNHPWEGLLVETGVWRTLEDFSSGSVCMVLASLPFEEDDYIRDYDEFRKVYGGSWQVTSSRKFDAEEIDAVSRAEVVASEYGNSVCFFMKGGGQTYIPLSNQSTLTPGDTVDMSSAILLTLHRDGSGDIIRVYA